jgi:uncharacterized integral membrane protein
MVTQRGGAQVAEGRRRVGSVWFVIGVAIAIPATVFAVSNVEPAQIEFLGWQALVPLWIVIGASLLAGMLIGAALTAAAGARRRRARRKQRQADPVEQTGPAEQG